MSDDVRRIGFRPDAPSGHCQRHLDSALDFAERQSQFYKLQVVGTRKQDDSRSTFDMCVVPGHEVFNAEQKCFAQNHQHGPSISFSLFADCQKHVIVHHSSTALCCQVLCMTWDYPRSLTLVILVCQRGGACGDNGEAIIFTSLHCAAFGTTMCC